MGSTLSSPIPSSPLDFVDRSWKQSDVVKEDIALPNGSKKLAFGKHDFHVYYANENCSIVTVAVFMSWAVMQCFMAL
jgi:hypothetical protein